MRLLLIDGASLAYRSYFAFKDKPLISSKGIKTSAPYAFTNSLLKLLNEIKPTHIAVIFDAKGKTFRHEIFEDYKAQRPKTPPDLVIQLSYIKEILDGFNIKRFEIPEVEADDVIASLGKEAERRGMEVFIASLDKDLFQLVSERIKIVDTRQGEVKILTEKDIEDRFGVKPQDIPILLALTGDKIDNVQGIPGIGEKTAAELIRNYGNIIERMESPDVKDEIIEHIKSYKDRFFEALSLVKLRDNIPIEFDLEDLRVREWNKEKLFKVFGEMEFYSLMREIAQKPSVELVETTFIPMDLLNAEVISVECFNENVLISSNGKVVYRIPLDAGIQFLDKFRGRIISFETKKQFKKIKKTIHFDFDILISAFLLDSDRPKFDPETIFLEYSGIGLSRDNEERRVAEICAASRIAYNLLQKEIQRWCLQEVLEKIELPLQKVLADMEEVGIKIDVDKIEKMSEEMARNLEEIKEKIYDLAGTKFNINSPKQIAEVLFTKHKLKPVKKTKTGYSTDEETLAKLAEIHPLPAAILDYREVFKLKSAYVDAFINLVDQKSHRIFPTYNQVGAATGRISCVNPNFQTIPVRSELGRSIRDIIVPEKGYKIMTADYSQIELRILAHFSGDKNLKEIFENNLDVHSMTASYIFRKRIQEITESERRKAKTVNFGIIYGISPYGLAKELNVTQSEAEAIIQNFFASFPGVMKWIQLNVDFAQKNGFVKTLFGRIRRIPYLNSGDPNLFEQGRRIAINTPIQGTAADIIKLGMVEIYEEFKRKSMNSRIILQVHDELLLEVPETEVEAAKEIVKEKMEVNVTLSVPLRVKIGVGDSWLSASNK